MKASRAAVRQLREMQGMGQTLEIIAEVLRIKFGQKVFDQAMVNLGLIEIETKSEPEPEPESEE